MATQSSSEPRATWKDSAHRLGESVSTEEKRMLQLLADGRTQAQIAKELGLHRSAVWRRVKKLRNRL